MLSRVLLIGVMSLVTACGGGSSVDSEDLDAVGDVIGKPVYYLGEEFEGLPLTQADAPGGRGQIVYGTCEIDDPEGPDGGSCSPPIQIQQWRPDAEQWRQASGCKRVGRVRGVPAVHHDSLVVFTGTAAVKIYARSRAETLRAARALRAVGEASAAPRLPPPRLPDVMQAVAAACS